MSSMAFSKASLAILDFDLSKSQWLQDWQPSERASQWGCWGRFWWRLVAEIDGSTLDCISCWEDDLESLRESGIILVTVETRFLSVACWG